MNDTEHKAIEISNKDSKIIVCTIQTGASPPSPTSSLDIYEVLDFSHFLISVISQREVAIKSFENFFIIFENLLIELARAFGKNM